MSDDVYEGQVGVTYMSANNYRRLLDVIRGSDMEPYELGMYSVVVPDSPAGLDVAFSALSEFQRQRGEVLDEQ